MAMEFNENELRTIYDALSDVQAVIWFDPEGNILDANDNFCATLGYSLDEIVGRHHRMFVTPQQANSPEYKAFWERLAAGDAFSDRYSRVHKSGSTIYIEASYNPIRNAEGKVEKVVKFAVDVTKKAEERALFLSKLDAITRGLAVIEFETDGTIRWANENFLNAMGYRLDEIQGQNHSMFVDPTYAQSADYKQFWSDLRNGKNHIGEFERLGKGGKPVWIQAGYNGIQNVEGKVYRVIKYATDVTAAHEASNAIASALKLLSDGDLTARLPQDLSEEYHTVRDVFNGTMAHLQEMILGILTASSAIHDESEGIVTTADELNKRCEQQAATLEETSAAMEEISKTVQGNTSKAEEVTKAAERAAKQAENGGSIVQQAIEAMGKIESGSSEIRKIISVIESIAFQTNLLALNAGVEAARAGDAGRGFAVVASEVRALAQRASDAARDINDLIETSGKEVAEGARLVNETGNALSEIVASVGEVSGGMNTIHQASSEQDTAVSEVNESISEIDLTTQQTAVVSEKNSASATMLTERAKELQNLISLFNKGEVATSTAASPAARRTTPTTPQAAKIGEATRLSTPRTPPAAARSAAAPVAAAAAAVQPVDNEDEDDWSLF